MWGHVFQPEICRGIGANTERLLCEDSFTFTPLFSSVEESQSSHGNPLQRRERRHTQDPTASKCVNPGNWILELVLVMSSVTGENIWLSSRKRNKTSSQGRVNAYECLRELHSECLLFGLWS